MSGLHNDFVFFFHRERRILFLQKKNGGFKAAKLPWHPQLVNRVAAGRRGVVLCGWFCGENSLWRKFWWVFLAPGGKISRKSLAIPEKV